MLARSFLAALLVLLSACGAATSPGPLTVLGLPHLNNNREEPPGVYSELLFLPGDRALAARRNDGVFHRLSLDRPREVETLDAWPDRAPVRAEAARDQTLRILSASGEPLGEVDTRLPLRNGLAVSADGRIVAAAEGVYSDEGHLTAIEVFDAQAQPVASFQPVAEAVGVWGLRLSRDGRRLAAGSQQNGRALLRVWSLPDGTELLRDRDYSAYWIRGVALSPDGRLAASADESGLLRVRNVDSGRIVFETDAGQVLQAAAFSNSGDLIAASCWDQTVRVWLLPPAAEAQP